MKDFKIICIALVLISTSAFGQTAKQKRADRQFNSFEFVKATTTYNKMIDTSFNQHYAMRKLADSYVMLRQPEKALGLYSRIVKQENVPSEYFLYYASALRSNGDYKESKKWMKAYKDANNENDSRVKAFFKNDDLASGIFNSIEQNTLSKVSFNTEFNDFGAVPFNGQVVFASSRDEGVSIKRLYAWDKQPMLDIFQVGSDKGTEENTVKIEGVNTIHHDGPATFNAAQDKMYFSRNNYHENQKSEDANGIMNIGIFTADLVGGTWTNVQPTNLNNPNYLVYHPSLSHDGKHLYFASDMPHEQAKGGTDIYVSDVNEDGSLGAPRNLGAIVNTEANESFPFIYDNGVLYFSSEGHVGLGMLDVFATVSDDQNNIVNVINLAAPINSKKDDFAYYLAEDGYTGYISSNRKGGQGGDDVYAFNRIPPLTLKGQIFDAVTNKPVENAKIVLGRKNGEEIAYFDTGADGAYEHLIPRDKEFVLKGSKEDYQDVSKDFSSFGLEKERELVVDLDIKLIPIIIPDLDTIYFDLDKSNIRPDAALVLDEVVRIMNEHPSMIIRMESHTDSRANDEYNIKLSERRAKSSYEYIISKGINPNRITEYKGMGETVLKNKCSNDVKCSEEEHQLNRRTEFYILEMD